MKKETILNIQKIESDDEPTLTYTVIEYDESSPIKLKEHDITVKLSDIDDKHIREIENLHDDYEVDLNEEAIRFLLDVVPTREANYPLIHLCHQVAERTRKAVANFVMLNPKSKNDMELQNDIEEVCIMNVIYNDLIPVDVIFVGFNAFTQNKHGPIYCVSGQHKHYLVTYPSTPKSLGGFDDYMQCYTIDSIKSKLAA